MSVWTSTAFKVFLLVEASAMAIALMIPLTPSKTGSRTGFADLFMAEPTYLEKVLVNFLAVNLLIGVIGVIFVLYVRRQEKDSDTGNP